MALASLHDTAGKPDDSDSDDEMLELDVFGENARLKALVSVKQGKWYAPC